MKQIIKTVIFGVALGAVAFFIPFVFKFILALALISFIFRMAFKGLGRRHFKRRFEEFKHDYSPIVPIDNQWYKLSIQGNGLVQHINIQD